MTNLPLELISILNLMRINFFIGQAPVQYMHYNISPYSAQRVLICQWLCLPPVHRIDHNVVWAMGEKAWKRVIDKLLRNLFATRCALWDAMHTSLVYSVLYCTYISICMCVGALSKWLLKALPISEKPKLAWLEFRYFGIILKLALLEFRYFGIISKLALLEFRYFSIISKLALLEFRYFD